MKMSGIVVASQIDRNEWTRRRCKSSDEEEDEDKKAELSSTLHRRAALVMTGSEHLQRQTKAWKNIHSLSTLYSDQPAGQGASTDSAEI